MKCQPEPVEGGMFDCITRLRQAQADSFWIYDSWFKLLLMIPTHSKTCSLVIVSGGAKRILSPWVGLANNPFSFSNKHNSQAALGLVCLMTIAFNKPLPLTFEINGERQILRGFDKNDFLTYQLPFEYNPEAKAEKFNIFLSEVLIEKELQEVLSEYLGYIFIKNNVLKLEKVLLLYGGGQNGKSVLFDIISIVQNTI